MQHSLKTRFNFGWTACVITPLGLMTELQAGTHSRLAVTAGIGPIEGAPAVPYVRTPDMLAGRTVGAV